MNHGKTGDKPVEIGGMYKHKDSEGSMSTEQKCY